VLVRLILAIPHFVTLIFLGIAAVVVAFLGWWGALFMGRLPDFAASYLTGYMRWNSRVLAYGMLLTDAYPPFSLDDEPDYPVRIATTQERLNRAAVFFRFILLIPANIVATVLVYGALTIVAFVAWIIVLITGKLPGSLHLAYTAVFRYLMRYYCYQYLLTPTYPVRGLFGDDEAAAPQPPAMPADPSAPGGYGTPGGYPGAADAPGGYPAAPGYGPWPGSEAGPGYGTPSDGTPGYGAPGYETPGYWTAPGQGGPESGAPGYGTPGSVWSAPGNPAYGAGAGAAGAPQVPGDPATWLLFLTSTAKRLVIFFIVLGAVLDLGAAAARSFANTHTVNNITTTNTASSQVNSAYSTLSTEVSQTSSADPRLAAPASRRLSTSSTRTTTPWARL
jgi:Domain of unknown function (DUF4389)